MNKAIFLDRDGVLNEEKGILYEKDKLEILPGVVEALKVLKEKGYKLFVITNQAVVARGLISEDGIIDLHSYFNSKIENLINQFYFCPHHPEMHPDVPEHAKKYRLTCECRKPAPGMILQAAKDHDIDISKSFMIGDMVTDIVAGKSAGCKTIMVESPNNTMLIQSGVAFDKTTKPDFSAKNLLEATKLIG